MKIINIVKTILALLAFSVIAIFAFLFIFVYDDIDACLDSGFCKEGLTLNTEHGQIIVNEKTCKEENGTWIEKRKTCQFKW